MYQNAFSLFDTLIQNFQKEDLKSMRFKCWVLPEDAKNGERVQKTFREILNLKGKNYGAFLVIKKRLFANRTGNQQVVAVCNGKSLGFRRKGAGGNSNETYRGAHESPTHFGNKDAISQLEELRLRFNDGEVTLHIDKIIVEDDVVCNSNEYIVDLHLILKSTDPEEFYSKCGGEIYLELCHKCPVDSRQAFDMRVENITVLEYKIHDSRRVADGLSLEVYERRIEQLKNSYRRSGAYVKKINMHHDTVLVWNTDADGNYVAKNDG